MGKFEKINRFSVRERVENYLEATNFRRRFFVSILSLVIFPLLILHFITSFCRIRSSPTEQEQISLKDGRQPVNGGKVAYHPLQTLLNIEQFFDYLEHRTFKCKNHTIMGGSTRLNFLDGDKFVCLDRGPPAGECVVLSFGINNEWSFDDEISSKLGCKVDRYSNLIANLNLEEEEIFYLKMDVEGHEILFFQDVFANSAALLSNVYQIGMEIHPQKLMDDVIEGTRAEKYWKYFQLLDLSGFKLASSIMNHNPKLQYYRNKRLRSKCYELVWINTMKK